MTVSIYGSRIAGLESVLAYQGRWFKQEAACPRAFVSILVGQMVLWLALLSRTQDRWPGW